MTKNKIKLLIKLIFIVIVFTYLFHKVPISDIIATVKQAKIFPLFAALLMFTAIRIVTALKWNILLRHHGICEPFSHIVNIIFTSQFIGMIFPTSLGVDAVRFVQIQRDKKNLAATAGSIVADRILAVASLALLSIVSGTLLYFFSSLENKKILLPVLYFAPPILMGFIFLMTSLPQILFDLTHKANRKFCNEHAFLTKIIEKAEEMHLMLYDLKKDRKMFASICSLNIIVQLGRVAEYYILFIALGAMVNPYYAIAVTPIIILLVLLPISPMGLGVKEGAFIYFFAQIGVAPDISITVSLLSHFLQFGGIIPGAVLFLQDRKSHTPA